jgi:hypothetical protein
MPDILLAEPDCSGERGPFVPQRRVLRAGGLHPVQRVGGVGPDPLAAADAWARIEAFFARHLPAGSGDAPG